MNDLVDKLLGGLSFDLLSLAVMLPLGVLTLIFSMIVTSWLVGGIDFGPVHHVAAKGALLIIAVTAVSFLSWGILLAGPIWFFGLMGLFRLSVRETRLLTQINWPLMVVWKLLVVVLRTL
jgi:hypothetical protein